MESKKAVYNNGSRHIKCRGAGARILPKNTIVVRVGYMI